MAEIRLVHLTKRFDGTTAVKDVNLEVKDREFMVLVGPSGCGKTTVLRLLSGLEEPSEGEVWIGNRLVNNVEPKDRNLAMVFQNYALYPHMTAEDNIAFGMRMRKIAPEEIQRRVHEAAEMLGIESLLSRRPAELSGGQRQRVALARAIVREPVAFLMDEPLSNLDAKLRLQTRAELVKLHARLGITTIYVTHDQVEAMTMGDRIAVMRDGEVQQVDTPLGLYNHPASRFVAGFIGSPGMNFVEAEVLGSAEDMSVDAGGFRLAVPPQKRGALQPYAGCPVILGLRPTDIFDTRNSAPVAPGEGNRLTGTVEFVEPLGAETIVHLRIGQDQLVVRVEGSLVPSAGEQLELVVDLDRLHFFDPDTEARIA
ncbi:MAG TPA: ABC transporter ATP-binding protein [Armatimonadota bacterium]|jgi:multiple sugar transport system ATP-binding protein